MRAASRIVSVLFKNGCTGKALCPGTMVHDGLSLCNLMNTWLKFETGFPVLVPSFRCSGRIEASIFFPSGIYEKRSFTVSECLGGIWFGYFVYVEESDKSVMTCPTVLYGFCQLAGDSKNFGLGNGIVKSVEVPIKMKRFLSCGAP